MTQIRIPLSAVIATKERAQSLLRTLNSLLSQALIPAEFIVVDSSDSEATRELIGNFAEKVGKSTIVRWTFTEVAGAAPQRNQGVAIATQPFIWFFDDDITFEPHCVSRLWNAIVSDPQLGGVNAMIVNQRYYPPGLISRVMFTIMHGNHAKSFAGKLIGPAINLLPEDCDDLPEVVPVEWLNTTCTIYRREALPSPPFDSFFTGYSMMEDVALSLRVGKKWRLANVRTARIVHESQSGKNKDTRKLAAMEIVNRHYVMRKVQEQQGVAPILRHCAWGLFQLLSVAASPETATPSVANVSRSARRTAAKHFLQGEMILRRPVQFTHRLGMGLASRFRNLYYRALGVEMTGYVWLRRIEIARNWSDVYLEKGVSLDNGVVIVTGGPLRRGKVTIRANTYVNRYTIFDGHESIEIGRRCMIGPHCITDGDHSKELGMPVQAQPMRKAPVVLEDEVWLGSHVVILPGVRIGHGAVIGAGSVVTRSIPANAIAYGVPARIVRMRGAMLETAAREAVE